MASRSQYWSCTKFADWIRGTPKGDAKTSAGWREWNRTSREKNPIRYWIAEEALDRIQDAVMWPIDKLYDAKYYINNRFITRTHSLTAHSRDIKSGHWCDMGDRFLPCLFNELVNFVEVELAWKNIAWDEKAREKYKSPWYATGWWRFRTWRSPQAGIDHLMWEINLVKDREWGVNPGDDEYGELTDQAKTAMEVYTLYRWWKEIYPARQDPHDESGWSAVCEQGRLNSAEGGFADFLDNKDPEFQRAKDQAHERLREIEEQRREEDTAMLIRLIKVRGSLWT